MTLEELHKILDVLEENYPNGVGIFSLSQKTNIEPQNLREYLAKYQDYFVSLAEKQSYGINRFGRFKGSLPDMLEDHKTYLKREKTKYYPLYLIVFIACFISSVVLISNAV